MTKISPKKARLPAANSQPHDGASGSGRKTPPKADLSGFPATAEQFMANAESEATKRAYASDIRQFKLGGGTIPADPQTVAKYLAQNAEKLSVATLQRRLTAIHRAHLEISSISPVNAEVVKRTMQGIRRTLGVQQRQVLPVLKDDLLAGLVMVDQQQPVKAARDRALLLVGFAGAFRRSELVSIRYEHITSLTNGVEIYLPTSKTDQEGKGRTVFIPHANGSRCPVKALKHWLELARINEGVVFRAVSRHDAVGHKGLTAQSVALVVKSVTTSMGGNPELVSGHSLRAGYCTQAAISGMQPYLIREQTGHKSDVTLAKYIRPIARRKLPSLL